QRGAHRRSGQAHGPRGRDHLRRPGFGRGQDPRHGVRGHHRGSQPRRARSYPPESSAGAGYPGLIGRAPARMDSEFNMAVERTLSILKPDALEKGIIGKIIDRFETRGLKPVAMKMKKLTREEAAGFYAVHKDRPFFGELVDFMTSGPDRKSTRLNSSHVKTSY